MTSNSLLLVLPEFIKTQPISTDDLKNLDETLGAISDASQDIEQTLKQWLKDHKEIKDQLRIFADNSREITKVKAPQKPPGVGNVFQELSEAVKQKLKELPDSK